MGRLQRTETGHGSGELSAPEGIGPQLAFPCGTEHPHAGASAPGFDPLQELSKPSLLAAPLRSFHQSFTILSS